MTYSRKGGDPMQTIHSRKKLYAIASMTLILLAGLMLNLTISYLIDSEYRDNVFAVGEVRLALFEDHYPSADEDRILAPKGMIPKDPRIVNNGVSNEYVFMSVTVPMWETRMVDETTLKITGDGKKLREIFDLHSDSSSAAAVPANAAFTITDTAEFTYDTGWLFLKSEEDPTAKTHTYLFGYTALLEPKTGSNSTTCLFDRLQLRNVLEGELPVDVVQEVVVKAYGIQSDQLLNHVTIADSSHVTEAELNSIYEIYRQQEG